MVDDSHGKCKGCAIIPKYRILVEPAQGKLIFYRDLIPTGDAKLSKKHLRFW
jgi:hypothetical protein